MKISSKSDIYFGAIELNNVEKEKSTSLLEQLKNPKSNPDKLKTQLMDVFDKQIQKEAKNKAGGLYYLEDVIQDMYLKFFETINNVKDLTTEKLVDILNNFKPAKRELKEEYRYGIESLSNNVKPHIEKPLENFITEKNLPVYLKERTTEEREKIFEEIKEITLESDLTSKEKNVLYKRARGKTYQKIAKESNVSKTSVNYRMRSTIAKIQDSQNVLPEKYEIFANNLKKLLNLPQSSEEIKKILINAPHLLNGTEEKYSKNVHTTSMLLGLKPNEYIQAALKQPQLFRLKSETIVKNITETSKLLGIDKKIFAQAALKQPSLFSLKPETISDSIVKSAKLLGIDQKIFLQLALKWPSLFCQKTETISDNVVKTTKLLGIDQKLFTQAALKQPQLFYQKPETIADNVVKTTKLLGVEQKVFAQAALKQPSLFCLKPETIADNVVKTAKLLGVDQKVFVQAALKQPQLFCLKPETVADNVVKTAKLLGVDQKVFARTALKQPQLFCLKPETAAGNVVKTAKLLGIDKKIFAQTALKQPSLFYQKPETVYKKSKIIEYHKLLQSKKVGKPVLSTYSVAELFEKMLNVLVKKNDNLNKAIDKKDFVNYLANVNKIYEFIIPQHEVAEDFVRFAHEFSQKVFGKQMFKFIIK